MAVYRYSPLTTGSRSIRLIRLLPGSDEADIYCKIFHFDLKESRHIFNYEALSYVWGDASERKRIYITEGDSSRSYLDVTVNLYSALCHLRDHGLERFMWIDAICVNQEDLEERSSQVGLMASIYASATRVVVWLGEYTTDDRFDSSFMVLRKMARLRQLRKAEGVTWKKTQDRMSNIKGIFSHELLKQFQALPENTNFLTLLRNPWFIRVWVLQEVAAAQSLLFLLGEQQLPGKIFCEAFDSFQEILLPTFDLKDRLGHRSLWREMSPVMYLINFDSYPGQSSLDILPLADLVNMFQTHEASDRRDKLYALLGMCTRRSLRDDSGISNVDYTASWTAVFRRVIRYIFGRNTRIKTCDRRHAALIEAKAMILGRVVHVVSGGGFSKQEVLFLPQQLNVMWSGWSELESFEWKQPRCSVYSGTRDVKIGDYVALVQGSEQPCIIRDCLDYFEVIAITATWQNICFGISGGSPSDIPLEVREWEWPTLKELITQFPYELTLVWVWGHSRGPPASRRKRLKSFPTVIETRKYSLVARGFEKNESSEKARLSRIYNKAKLFDDLDDDEGIRLLRVQFEAEWNRLQKIKWVRDSAPMKFLEKLHRIVPDKDRRYAYKWIKHQRHMIVACKLESLQDLKTLRKGESQTGTPFASDCSNFDKLSETQLIHLLGRIRDGNPSKTRLRESVLVTLLPARMNITEAMLIQALKMSGPLASNFLSINPPWPILTPGMVVAAVENSPKMVKRLFDSFPNVKHFDPAIFAASGSTLSNDPITSTIILHRDQTDSETICHLLEKATLNHAQSSSDVERTISWSDFYSLNAKRIAHLIEHTDLCETAASNPRGKVLGHLYEMYGHRAREGLSRRDYAIYSRDYSLNAKDIWRTEQDFLTWHAGELDWLQIHTESDRSEKELILENVRAFLLIRENF